MYFDANVICECGAVMFLRVPQPQSKVREVRCLNRYCERRNQWRKIELPDVTEVIEEKDDGPAP